VVVPPSLEVLEVGAAVGHRVADDVPHRNPEALLQPTGEMQGCVDLPIAAQDLTVRPMRAAAGLLDHLDSDRAVVQPDRVPATDPRPDEPVDPAALFDHEVRADPGQLPHIWGVGGERLPCRPVARPSGEVKDDRPRMVQTPLPPAVVSG